MSLVEKLRKAREKQVEVGGFTFTVRRPTDVEMMRLQGRDVEALIGFVVGWDGVREMDVLASGDGSVLPFDAVVAREWLSDRPDLLTPLVDAVIDGYKAHAQGLGDAAKN